MTQVTVVGAGTAGLAAALAASQAGADVTVLERGERIGGTTALSGGVAWLPANDRTDDTPEQALAYLRALALGDVVDELVEVFAREAGATAAWLERETPLRWQAIPYPDYHAELDGARESGRALEPAAYDAPERIRDLIRDAPNRSGSITYAELLAGGADDDELARRDAAGTLTAGKALLGCLLEACLDAGVELRTGTRVTELPEDGAVVLATGGFDRDEQLVRAFLRGPMLAPTGAPGLVGDGLRLAMGAGAALGAMSEAWWCPATRIPGETIDGEPMFRLLLPERTRPRSLMVDGSGRRFVDEAQNYNDLGRALLNFEPQSFSYPHVPAWLVFDSGYRRAYPLGPLAPDAPDPDWLARAGSVAALAEAIGVPPAELEATVEPVQRGRRARRGSGARTRLHGVRPLHRRPRSRGRGAVLRSPGASGVPRDEGRSAHRRARPRALDRRRRADPAPLRGGERRREPARPRLPRGRRDARAGARLRRAGRPRRRGGRMSDRAPIEVMPLGDVLVRAARRWPESIAVAFPDRRLTTVELLADAYRVARGLHALGVRRGERVGIVAPNCVDYHAALFGGALLGVEVVTVNARFRATELAYVFEDAALAAVLTSDVLGDEVDFVGLLRGAIPNAPSVRHAVMLGASSPEGFVDRAELDRLAETVDDATIDAAADRVRVRDVAIMMYTSGTTAQPKGCPLTHEAIVRTSQAMVTRFALTGDDVWWDPLPMFHLSSILPLTCALLVGSPFATMVDFEPGTALAQVERERVTFLWSTFPTITQELVGHPDFGSTDTSTIRLVNQVAPPDLQRGLQRALPGAVQVSAYGCTELGGIVAMNDPAEDAESRATTCGPPFAGVELRIVDPETGAEVAPGEPGEITGRGPGAVRGVPQLPGAERGGDRRRRLLPHRRHRQRRRVGPAELPRPHEGHAQGRRRERRVPRDRVVPRHPPRRAARAGRRHPRRAPRRGARRLRPARAGAEPRRRRS